MYNTFYIGIDAVFEGIWTVRILGGNRVDINSVGRVTLSRILVAFSESISFLLVIYQFIRIILPLSKYPL